MIPDRFKFARELRALTQQQVADEIHVNQSTVANIESGRLAPSSEYLDAFSTHLGFPREFFSKDVPSESLPVGSLALFRALAVVTAREQARTHRYAQIAYECYNSLAQKVNPLELRLPQLTGEAPESAARITRASLGLSPAAPIRDLTFEIEKAGVVVLALPVTKEAIDAFSMWDSHESDKPLVFVLGDGPGDRRRFSIAHEVGHLVMHKSLKGSVREVEKQASRFASALLLPASAMRDEITRPVTLTGLASLKTKWRVSMQAIVMRAFDLEIVTDRQKRYLFQKMAKKGWRTREPAALDVPVEMPRALRQMAELLYGDPVDHESLARDASLPVDVVAETLRAHRGPSQRVQKIVQFPGVSS